MPVLQRILLFDSFFAGDFSNELPHNLVEPIRVQNVEEHPEYEHDVFEVPWQTCLTGWVVPILPAGDEDPPP